jgi:predicted RNA-binding protein with PUA-like domain
MAFWLLKTEPDDYSYDDLARDQRCAWDGVGNALALKHIREMKKGDQALLYHTGKEKAVVGIASVVTDAYPDPAGDDERMVVIDLKPAKRLKHPVTLHRIKADPAFAEWELVRISRLSVMPVPAQLWKRLEQLSETEDE